MNMTQTKQPTCGGQLYPSRIGRFGTIVPCPVCGKAVKLRLPFNGNQTGWVQVPRHKPGHGKGDKNHAPTGQKGKK